MRLIKSALKFATNLLLLRASSQLKLLGRSQTISQSFSSQEYAHEIDWWLNLRERKFSESIANAVIDPSNVNAVHVGVSLQLKLMYMLRFLENVAENAVAGDKELLRTVV
jgi:hypothetical protein